MKTACQIHQTITYTFPFAKYRRPNNSYRLMRDLSFRRLSPCSISAGVQYPTLSFPLFSINCMASSNDRPPVTEKKEERTKEKEDGKEAKKAPPPPPPEMPEPGDCCGSGCVRCVWDVYYDEVEAYNKLYKSHPN